MEPKNKEVMKPRWADLPEELLEIIMSKLVFADHARVRAVCKRFQSLRKIQPARQLPWLIRVELDTRMTSRAKSTSYHLYDPLYQKTYPFKGNRKGFPQVIRAYCSKNGLLLSESDTFLFLYNPFTLKKIEFTPILRVYISFNATFECSPTSDEYLICAMEFSPILPYLIRTCSSKDKSWTTTTFKPNSNFEYFPESSLVYKDGLLYCIGIEGHVAIFDIAQKTWSLIAIVSHDPNMGGCINTLVDAGDNVMYVAKQYYYNNTSNVRCWRIDSSQNRLVKIKSLGGETLFLSYKSKYVFVPQSVLHERMGDWVCDNFWSPEFNYEFRKSYEMGFCFLKNGETGTCNMIEGRSDVKKFYSLRNNFIDVEEFWIEPRL